MAVSKDVTRFEPSEGLYTTNLLKKKNPSKSMNRLPKGMYILHICNPHSPSCHYTLIMSLWLKVAACWNYAMYSKCTPQISWNVRFFMNPPKWEWSMHELQMYISDSMGHLTLQITTKQPWVAWTQDEISRFCDLLCTDPLLNNVKCYVTKKKTYYQIMFDFRLNMIKLFLYTNAFGET